MRTAIATSLLVATMLSGAGAYAQDTTATPPAGAEPAKPSARSTTSTAPTDPKKLEEARTRFARGLQLFDEKNYEAARVELERAYELAPTWKLLYNIGVCYGMRGDYVEAIKDLERYLKEGTDIPPSRQADVNKELSNLRPRIAHLTVKVNVPGADVLLDDQTVGKAPMDEPIMVNPGRRKVSAAKTGYFPANQIVTAAGSDNLEVTIELKALPKANTASNPYLVRTIAAWSVTGVGALVGGTLGILASSAADDLKKKVQSITTRDDLDKTKSQVQTLSLAADITFGVTAAAAVVATYFTVKFAGWKADDDDKEKNRQQPDDKLRLGFGAWPGGGVITGSF